MSAKTEEGFDELRRMIVDAAFDKQAFPTFGSKEPEPTGHLREAAAESPGGMSVTWRRCRVGRQSENSQRKHAAFI